jgi:hypothetical protein
MQLVGLKSIHVGEPLASGITSSTASTVASFAAIKQPYKGGVSTNFTTPSKTEFYREGEDSPFYAAYDATTGSKELSWTCADFDDATMNFYFGTTEPEEGKMYEGVKAFVFDSNSGGSLAFARLKYIAQLSGSLNSTDPLQISVSATVLAPENGGRAWGPITTPDYSK